MGSSSDTPIDATTDFEELSARVRTQSQRAPGSDTERVTIRSFEDVSSETLSELLETAESGASHPGDLVFVLSRTNAERLREQEFDLDESDDLADELGRPIQVEDEMPDDTILLLAPDAVDGEEIVDPDAIACGLVGTTD
ncbi:hypothetical protein [Halopiger djelfimassiliensis]|uniref:hypothetical protein n=1 Tax=Halopiger djelfimassiliensis TaxID=1293047 RepID=UPI000677EA0D|nr:hypothetical protein [Halopiger djelfimassiliensis]